MCDCCAWPISLTQDGDSPLDVAEAVECTHGASAIRKAMSAATARLLELCSTSNTSADQIRELVEDFGADLSICDEVRWRCWVLL